MPQHPGGACGAVRNLKRVCRQPASQPERQSRPGESRRWRVLRRPERGRPGNRERERERARERAEKESKKTWSRYPRFGLISGPVDRTAGITRGKGEGSAPYYFLCIRTLSSPVLAAPHLTSPCLSTYLWSAMAVHSYPRYLSHVAPYTSYLCTRGRGEGRGGSGKEGPQVSWVVGC